MRRIRMNRKYKYTIMLYSIFQVVIGIVLLIMTKRVLDIRSDPYVKEQLVVSVLIIIIGLASLIFNIKYIKGYRRVKRRITYGNVTEVQGDAV